MWPSLIANFAIVGLFVSGWLQAQEYLGRFKRHNRRLLFGLTMGFGALSSMLLSVQLSPGIFLDLRSTFLAISAFIGGPLAAWLTLTMVLIYRFGVGGAGMWGAAVSAVVVVAIGLIGNRLIGRRTPGWVASAAFASVSAAAPMVGMLFVPSTANDSAVFSVVIPVVGLGFLATFLAVSSIARTRRAVEERKLLRAALQQAPDYLYVKDRDSRFVAANHAVAVVNGLGSADDLKGLTDFDLATDDMARALFAAEQDLIRTGNPILNFEECLPSTNGPRWYLTSKSPVHNVDDEVIGLAGTTRDITERKQLERLVAEGRSKLETVLGEMSDGIAQFDRTGTLLLCNEQYRELFPFTKGMRVVGAQLPALLAASVATGEQLDVPPERVEGWISSVVASLSEGGEAEARLFDGRWLHIRTRPVADGGAIVVVSDISKIKQAEAGLLALTEQLRTLADTDGLTGLTNRRHFDELLETELLRTRRSLSPLSLLMLDIDRFKAFNDTYGHQAGDDCIRLVASVLSKGSKRPADVVARYGGEEICVVLPDTDEEGAYWLADQLRIAVRDLGIVHAGSEKSVVTVSVGLATCSAQQPMTPAEIIRRADAALYVAKSAGRDRVMGWRASQGAKVA